MTAMSVLRDALDEANRLSHRASETNDPVDIMRARYAAERIVPAVEWELVKERATKRLSELARRAGERVGK